MSYCPYFFIKNCLLIKIVYSLLPIMCNISIPILEPYVAHHNCTFECEFNQKFCGLDKKCAIHGGPVVVTVAVSTYPKHNLKLVY